MENLTTAAPGGHEDGWTCNLAYALVYFVVTVVPGALMSGSWFGAVFFSFVYFVFYNAVWGAFLSWMFFRQLPKVFSLGFLFKVLRNLSNLRLLWDELVNIDFEKILLRSFKRAAWLLPGLPVVPCGVFYVLSDDGSVWGIILRAAGYWISGIAGFWLARG